MSSHTGQRVDGPRRAPRRQDRRALGTGRIWRRKQAKGSVWVGDWKGADRRRHRRVLSSDRRVAERKMADIIRNRDLVAAGLAIEDGFDLVASDVIEEFMEDLRARRTRSYADRAEGILERVTTRMRVQTLRDFQPQPFLLYRRQRLREGRANRTVNMELNTVRTMLNWAVRTGYIAFNPLQAVEKLPAGKAYEKRPRRAMTDEEIERFLEASAQMDAERTDRALAVKSIAVRGPGFAAVERTPRIPQTPLWQTLLETGARFGELVQTTWRDVTELRATLRLRASTTKSRKERTIPVRRELAGMIAGLRMVHHRVLGRLPSAGDLIFLSPKGGSWVGQRRRALTRFEQTLEAAGIPKIDEGGEKLDIHSLRHSAASRWARAGVPLQKAQALLGHSDPALTARVYTHLEAEDLRGAVEGVGGTRALG